MTDAATATPSPSAAPPRKRGFLRRLTRWVVVLLLLVALAPLALRLGFVRDFVARRASAALGAEVTLEGASAWWTSGIELTGVTVASPAGHDGPLARVARVHVAVALLDLLKGDVDAKVRVERPVVTLRRNAAQRWNTEALARARGSDADDKASSGRGGPRLEVEVVDGVFEAHGVGPEVERVSHIDFRATLAADGAMAATLGMLAERAGLAGADARLAFKASQTPGQPAPFEAEIPTLDLARLAGLIEGFTGLKGLQGTTRLTARGTLDDAGNVAGTLTLQGEEFRARTAGGASVRLGSVRGTIDVRQGTEGQGAQGDLTLGEVEVQSGPGVEAHTLSQPQVTVRFDARRAGDGTLTLPQLELAAGEALTLRATTPLTLRHGGADGTRVEGRAELRADLAQLAALKDFVPGLATLSSGRVIASLEGRPAAGLDVALGARVADLVLAPGELVAEGYSDRDITLQASVARGVDGATAVAVFALTSSIARLQGAQPFVVRFDDGLRPSFAGPLDLSVDLEALTRAFGSTLGLAPGERVGGTLALRGNASGSASAGRLDAALTGAGLRLPSAWSNQRAPGTLDGRLLATWTPEGFTLEARDVKGLGLGAEGQVTFGTQAQLAAEARLDADLEQVRSWFGPRLGLAPTSTLAGGLRTTLSLRSRAGGRRVEGTTRVAALSYRATPQGAPLEEPALTLEHTLELDDGDVPVRLEVLRVRGNGYQADLSGSAVGGAAGVLDLKGTLEGDAARIAERARVFLGPDLQDLLGQGQVQGRITWRGPGADLLAQSTADVNLTLGTWSASGVQLDDVRLTLRRATPTQPYALEVGSGMNGGAHQTRMALTPRGPALAWTLHLGLQGVDMGRVLTTGPAAKRLAYVLPTLLPMDSATPVLSGRMDATVDLEADDLGGEAMLASLRGPGTLSLTQGALGQSSLFSALGGGAPGGGLGEVGRVLGQVAPAVGRELAGFARSVAFQQITSRFQLAQRRVEVLETKMLAEAHRLELKGVVTFDQQVDLAARLWLGGKAGDELQRVLPDQTLPLRIRNSLAKPQIVPDLKVSDLLQGAVPKPGDILKDPAKALEEAKKLKDRLRDLLPR